jgi:predicted Holliday junction resolvase-like endonuclease
MSLLKEAKKVIRMLEEKGFYAECPCCGKHFLLKDAGLFYRDDFTPEAEELYLQLVEGLEERKKEYKEMRRAISQRSEISAKAVNIGFVLERIAPCFSTFPFDRNDCRSLFDPIDYIVFEGLRKRGYVNRIVFVDIKTGKGRLTEKETEIRELVKRRRVLFDIY